MVNDLPTGLPIGPFPRGVAVPNGDQIARAGVPPPRPSTLSISPGFCAAPKQTFGGLLTFADATIIWLIHNSPAWFVWSCRYFSDWMHVQQAGHVPLFTSRAPDIESGTLKSKFPFNFMIL